MNSSPANRGSNQVIGMVLIVLGALFLLGQVVDFGDIIGNWGWPFFIILPGLLMLIWSIIGGKSVSGLAIPGSIVTTVGLILFFQNATDRYESWAYAWGLITAAAGFGRYLQSSLNGDAAGRAQGLQAARVGLILFVGFGAFFELFIFNQSAFARYLVPLALIAFGIFMVMRNSGTSISKPNPQEP